MRALARASLVALALIVCAWFVLGARQARDTARAEALVNTSAQLSSAQVSRARSLLGSAGALNPDLTVDTLRGQLALDQNQSRRALQILESVTRREPMNLDAWVLLAQATQRGNQRIFTHAIAVLGRLAPAPKGK
jgi:predicted Zn-dependent protease